MLSDKQCNVRKVRPLYICFALTFLHRKNSPDDLGPVLKLGIVLHGTEKPSHVDHLMALKPLETWHVILFSDWKCTYERATVSKQMRNVQPVVIQDTQMKAAAITFGVWSDAGSEGWPLCLFSAPKHGRRLSTTGTDSKIIWRCISRATKYSDCIVWGTEFEIYINEKNYRYTCFCIFMYTCIFIYTFLHFYLYDIQWA